MNANALRDRPYTEWIDDELQAQWVAGYAAGNNARRRSDSYADALFPVGVMAVLGWILYVLLVVI